MQYSQLMDGIAGIIYSDVFQVTNLMTPMLNTMAHRGRTIQDISTIKNVQLGTCGHQILSDAQKNVYVGIDGTIYNNVALQQELKELGRKVTTKHPSETISLAYQEWGTEFFDRLLGDFAIMIYDAKKELLYLVRDRIGKKPLYWYHDQHHFIFASELKAILASGAVPQTIARDAIASYFYFGYIPQDMTPINNVNKLLPAYFLELNVKAESKTISSYWSYSSYFKNREENTGTVVKKLDQLLIDSVNLRIPDTQTIGCFISGGLGSASIAHYLKKLSPHPITGFSVEFEGQNDEDTRAASQVADALHIPHVSKSITPDTFLDPLVKVVWHLDEPLADPNIVATWELASLSSHQTNAVFSGMGSDELLAGHNRYTLKEYHLNIWQRLSQMPLPLLKYLLLPFLKLFSKSSAYELIKQSRTNPLQVEFIRQNALFDEKQLAFASPRLSGLFDPELFLNKFQNLFKFQSNVASYLYFDVKTRLVDCFLLQYERLTAANGLDWYTPYLDKRIVEYLAGLYEPADLSEGETAKYLKTLLKNVFPEAFVKRPKVARENFLNPWLQNPHLKEAFSLLPDGVLVENGLFSKDALLAELSGQSRGNQPFRRLFSVLVLEIWYRLFIHQPVSSEPPSLTVKELLSQK